MLAALPAPVRAGDRIELSLAAGWLRPALDGSYTHRYVPRVDFDVTSGGDAGHTLGLRGEDALALRGSLGVRLGSRLGLELLVVGARCDMGGASTPYATRLEYTSRQPPSYEPRRFVSEAEIPWPDAEGRLRQLAFGLNLRSRLVDGPSLIFDLSGGPTLHCVSGKLQSLAYTAYFLGGHSVLFSDTYRLAVELKAGWAFGLDVGGELGTRLGAHASLLLEARYFLAGSVRLEPELARIANADEVVRQRTLGEIAARLQLAPLELDPSFFAASLGLRLRF